MSKKLVFDLLYVFLIIALICFMGYVVMFLQGEAKDCLKDPIVYFESKSYGATCYCFNAGDLYDPNS